MTTTALEDKHINKVEQTALEFMAKCKATGVAIEDCNGSVITLCKRFRPGDTAAYCRAESEVGIIYSIRQTEPGSTWGTDGASIGGHAGLTGGYMRLHRSGCSRKVLAIIKKHTARGF